MLFQTQGFILLFLPVTLILFHAAIGRPVVREWVLVVASAIFYGAWDIRFLPLLAAHTILSWLAAGVFLRTGRRWVLDLAIAANLASLAFFKYTAFALSSLAVLLGFPVPAFDILLPVGISFFTFEIVSYLVDLRRGADRAYPLRRFALYVGFFPHLIAGPIVRHGEIIPQLDSAPLRAGLGRRLAAGVAFFTLGCAKKVFLADAIAPYADARFAAAAAGVPTLADAWGGTLAFTFQLFLDFSAYSEMAIGLGLLFGLRFPDNFDMPYRAASVREFWRRWHMTLSRYIRDYLYIPLGGSRHGFGRFCYASLVSMGLCGLWHGAGWTYVAWGLLHGVGLIVCHVWQGRGRSLPRPAAWLLTFVFVAVGWVLFRAPDFTVAGHMLAGLTGAGGLAPSVGVPGILAAAALASLAIPSTQSLAEGRFLKPSALQGAALAGILLAALLAVGEGQPTTFIYFQF